MSKTAPIRSVHLASLVSGDALDCITEAGKAFLSKPGEEAIGTVLTNLGERTGVDRVWIIEYDADLTSFYNSHEWCARGISSYLEDLQDAPVSLIGWLHRQLLRGDAVMINDVLALPASARMLRREMLRQGDKSVLSVPVFHDGRLRAIIGYDAVREAREWSDEEIAVLNGCGRMLAEVRYGMQRDTFPTGGSAFHEPLIYVGGGGMMRGIALAQIAGIRSQRNTTQVWLTNGGSIADRRSLAAWRVLLPPAKFPSIHRTAIVSLRHIARLDKHAGAGFHWQVHVRGAEQDWPVSRAFRKELVERLGF